MHPRLSKRAGFTLVLVVWSLGLCSLMIVSFLSMARDRLHAGANIGASARAEALAESGVNLTLLSILAIQEPTESETTKFSSTPTFCSLPGGNLAILVEDERGKIDLNAANSELLSRLLLGFGVESGKVQPLVESIVAFRTAPTNGLAIEERLYRNAGRPFPPRKGLFQSGLELDQVLGMDGELFARLRPFVTVHSFASDVNASFASPQLLQALGERSASPPAGSATPGGAFLIHVEAAADAGGYFVREAIVTRGGQGVANLSVKEWRRGDVRFRELLSGNIRSGVTC